MNNQQASDTTSHDDTIALIVAAASTNSVNVPIQPSVLFSEFLNNALPFECPSVAIDDRVVEVLVTAYAKDSAVS